MRFRDYLSPFATAAVNAFLKKPQSSILYAVTTLVSAFGRHAEFVPPLVQMLEALSQRTLQVLSEAAAMIAAPDIVTEYFEMMDRGTIRFPQAMLGTPLVDNARECAAAALRSPLEHREALGAVAKFLHGLCHRELNPQLAAGFLKDTAPAGPWGPAQARGQSLWQCVVQALVSKPSFLLEECSYIVLDMAQLLPGETCEWGAAALLPVPEAVLAAQHKEEFMKGLQAA